VGGPKSEEETDGNDRSDRRPANLNTECIGGES
jgi:hypothetical protein